MTAALPSEEHQAEASRSLGAVQETVQQEREEEDILEARILTADNLPLGPGQWQHEHAGDAAHCTTCMLPSLLLLGLMHIQSLLCTSLLSLGMQAHARAGYAAH